MDSKLREKVFNGERPKSIKDVYLLTSKITGFDVPLIKFVIQNLFKNIHYYFIRPWLVTKGYIEIGGAFRFKYKDTEIRKTAHDNGFYRLVINKKVEYERQTKNALDNGRARKYFEEGQEWEHHPWGQYGYDKRVACTTNTKGKKGKGGITDEGTNA